MKWVAKDGLLPFFSTVEKFRFEMPLGSWEPMEVQITLWQSEALGTLLWAMSLIDMPPPGAPFEWTDVMRVFGTAESEQELVVLLRPRSTEEVFKAEMVAETWLWRGRVRKQEKSDVAATPQHAARIRQIANLARAQELVSELIDSDFVIAGRPYSELSDHEAVISSMVAFERSIALLWVIGIERDWDRLRALISAREQQGDATPPEFLTPPPERPGAVYHRPSEEHAARRSLCLTALLLRVGLEQHGPDADGRGFADGINEWLATSGLEGDLSQKEQSLLQLPAGSWGRQEVIDALWRTEAHGVLLWALSVIDDMPPYDEPFRPMFEESGVMRPPDAFLSRVALRDSDEISKARDVAELWHWRSRTTQTIRLGMAPPPGVTYQKILEITASAAHEKGELPPPIAGDFPLFGRAYRDLSEDQYQVASSIARERHLALNWLCGYSPDWDRTPTDT
jgi:hypothetical protein